MCTSCWFRRSCSAIAKTVLAEADKLDKWLSNEIATAVPIAQPVKAAPYFAWAQYADAGQDSGLARPAGAPPYVKAMWHYARGVAFAAKKDAAGARREADAIQRIAQETDWSILDAWGIPVRPVLEVAQGVVLARAAQAEGDNTAAIDLWRKAAEAEDTIPYMEPPFWYYPVRQSLGAALLKRRPAGRSREGVQCRTRTRPRQRLGALRPRAGGQSQRRRGCPKQGCRRTREVLARQSRDVEPGAALKVPVGRCSGVLQADRRRRQKGGGAQYC